MKTVLSAIKSGTGAPGARIGCGFAAVFAVGASLGVMPGCAEQMPFDVLPVEIVARVGGTETEADGAPGGESDTPSESPQPPSDPASPPSDPVPPSSDAADESPAPPDSGDPTSQREALRVVAVGDSVTEGYGDDDADPRGYPGALLDQLQPGRPGSSMLNLGRYGWTSGELINGTDSEASQLERALATDPDVACVWIGSNDLWRLYENGPAEGTSAADEAANLATFAANIEAIVRRLSAASVTVCVGLMDDQALRPVSQDRATLPNTTAAELEQMSAQVVRYNEVIRSVAARYGATVVDFYNTTIFTSSATLNFDGIHPNGTGYDQVAGMWFAAIEEALN